MRAFLGLTAAAIMATPALWPLDHKPRPPMRCYHEGDVAAYRSELSICRDGFWQTGPIESNRLIEASQIESSQRQ